MQLFYGRSLAVSTEVHYDIYLIRTYTLATAGLLLGAWQGELCDPLPYLSRDTPAGPNRLSNLFLGPIELFFFFSKKKLMYI